MGLTIPGIGTETSPTWASDLNADLSAIDSHNHSSGQGVPITPNGLNINADLAFQSNNATQLRSTRFTPQGSALSGASDVGCLFVVGNELYYNDVTGGHHVQITSNGNVNATSSGISSGTASAAFAGGVLAVKSSSTSGADVLMLSAVLTNSGNLTNQLTLQAPALSSSIIETLPAIPAAQSFMAIDSSGTMSAYAPVASGLTGSNIAANVNLAGTSVQAGSQNVVVSQTNATNGLAVIRGIISSTFTVVSGEGFTVSNPGSQPGEFLITWDTGFSDTPSVCVNVMDLAFAAFSVNVYPSSTQCYVYVMESANNTPISEQISFIAIGQRT